MVGATITQEQTNHIEPVWLCGASSEVLEKSLRDAGLVLTGSQTPNAWGAMVYFAPMSADETGRTSIVDYVASVLEDFVSKARVAARALAEQGGGQIVVVCDIIAHCGRAGHPARSAADAALIGASKCLAKELGRYKVDVNVICHGSQPELGVALELSNAERKLFDMMGLGADGTPAMLAKNIAHLARGGHGMTGQVMNVDNGVVV